MTGNTNRTILTEAVQVGRLKHAADGTSLRLHLGGLALGVGIVAEAGGNVASALIGWGAVTAGLAVRDLYRS